MRSELMRVAQRRLVNETVSGVLDRPNRIIAAPFLRARRMGIMLQLLPLHSRPAPI